MFKEDAVPPDATVDPFDMPTQASTEQIIKKASCKESDRVSALRSIFADFRELDGSRPIDLQREAALRRRRVDLPAEFFAYQCSKAGRGFCFTMDDEGVARWRVEAAEPVE